jgi:hypothetical protein
MYTHPGIMKWLQFVFNPCMYLLFPHICCMQYSIIAPLTFYGSLNMLI